MKLDKKHNIIFGLIFFLQFFIHGCSLFGIKPEAETVATVPPPPPKEKPVRFSDNPNMGVFNANKYRHKTKSQLEDENEVHARAGSLWNSEGQSAYLFSQNTIRREGELLKVKLDGVSRSQVEIKVNVIKKLLARVETPQVIPNNQNNPNNGDPNSNLSGGLAANQNSNPGQNTLGNAAGAGGATNNATRNPANENANSKAVNSPSTNTNAGAAAGANANITPGSTKPASAQNQNEDMGPEFNVDTIPTRIVERLADGNYRVKGSQPFMIGKREFKVIVMGLVRPDDFNEEGISAGKLLDPQFDVVSLRRSQQ